MEIWPPSCYCLAGGLLSLAATLLLKKTDKLSILAVSVMGGICHNIGQLIVAMLVVENLKSIFYVPVLLFSGISYQPAHRYRIPSDSSSSSKWA
ncbi:MAG: Gx transporter family protein [Eubacterium ramulus]